MKKRRRIEIAAFCRRTTMVKEHSKANPRARAAEAGNTKDTQKGVPLMRYRKWFLAGILVVGVLASTTSPALASTFSTIDVPGATFTQTRRINDRGQIVGFYGAGGTNHGFVLEKGTFTPIDVPGATFTLAFGINDRSQIVGSYGAGGAEHGFLLDRGTFTAIDVPGATLTRAFGINNRGQIVGFYVAGGTNHGFVWF
jgi:hypothetical protein